MIRKIKKIVQRTLGIKLIRKSLISLNVAVLSVVSRFRLASILYHFVFFFVYAREQHAQIHGRYQYYKNLKRVTHSRTPLRRNVHRLEKGMSMRPLRKVFALDYIGETVELYTERVRQFNEWPESIDLSELEWAHDVLDRYFKVVDKNPFLKGLDQRFTEANFKAGNSDLEKAPFKRGPHKPAPVDYENLAQLAMRRRSVRWYKQKRVPRALIDKALMIARQSPSACNRLPYEFKIYDDPKLAKKIAGIPFGTAGYSDNVPAVVVLVGKLDNYFSSRDRHVIYIDSSMAAMAFMFALETVGLASGAINWPDFEPQERKMQKALGLRVDERPIMLMSVGYPDPKGYIPYSQKKSLDGLRSYNSFGPNAKLVRRDG